MTYKIIKPQVIETSMLDDKDMLRQFVHMYLSQSPYDFEKLETSIYTADFENIRNHAHHIKPTMIYIGAHALHSNFQELEDLARAGNDLPEIQRKFEETKSLFENMLSELRFFLSEIP